MELKELSRRISRYRANVENLQLEKNRLFNEIDALDQDALKIKEYKWQAQNRFKCRVDNIAGRTAVMASILHFFSTGNAGVHRE
jgi:chromosome segregation ATPase